MPIAAKVAARNVPNRPLRVPCFGASSPVRASNACRATAVTRGPAWSFGRPLLLRAGRRAFRNRAAAFDAAVSRASRRLPRYSRWHAISWTSSSTASTAAAPSAGSSEGVGQSGGGFKSESAIAASAVRDSPPSTFVFERLTNPGLFEGGVSTAAYMNVAVGSQGAKDTRSAAAFFASVSRLLAAVALSTSWRPGNREDVPYLRPCPGGTPSIGFSAPWGRPPTGRRLRAPARRPPSRPVSCPPSGEDQATSRRRPWASRHPLPLWMGIISQSAETS